MYLTVVRVNEEKSYDQMQLTMSRWYSLNHSMEFVLEIKESRLVSVSQRRLENYYPFLQKEGNLQEILDSIEIFLQNKLKEDTLNLLPDHCKATIPSPIAIITLQKV